MNPRSQLKRFSMLAHESHEPPAKCHLSVACALYLHRLAAARCLSDALPCIHRRFLGAGGGWWSSIILLGTAQLEQQEALTAAWRPERGSLSLRWRCAARWHALLARVARAMPGTSLRKSEGYGEAGGLRVE